MNAKVMLMKLILGKLSLVSNIQPLGWGAGDGQILPVLSALEPPRGCRPRWGFA